MRAPRRLGLAAPLLFALARCGGCDSAPEDAVTHCEVTTILPAAAKTDILFVVDDSGSMAAEQANLATSFHAFVERLASSAVHNDFQIGVTTTSVDWPEYESGSSGPYGVQTTYPDGRPYPAGALVAAAGKPTLLAADSQTLVEDFDANVHVGTDGSAKEQGLRAALLAVTDRIADGSNEGLLRPGARLAVIIVSDEDDCSDLASPPALIFTEGGNGCHSAEDAAKLPPISDFVSALTGQLAGEARDVVVAVIGSVDPRTKEPAIACNPTQAYPAYRYAAFVSAFDGGGYIDSVCQGDFSDTLRVIAGLIDPGQTVDLAETPADPRLLAARVTRADGTEVACPVAVAGSADAAAAGAVYLAPEGNLPARLTFQGDCSLGQGDQVHIEVLCAG
jgi:hypothetical protein